MTIDGTFLVALHFDAMQLLSGFDVADFEAEEVVDVDIAQGLRTIHRKRPNRTCKRSHGCDDLVGRRIGDRKER